MRFTGGVALGFHFGRGHSDNIIYCTFFLRSSLVQGYSGDLFFFLFFTVIFGIHLQCQTFITKLQIYLELFLELRKSYDPRGSHKAATDAVSGTAFNGEQLFRVGKRYDV